MLYDRNTPDCHMQSNYRKKKQWRRERGQIEGFFFEMHCSETQTRKIHKQQDAQKKNFREAKRSALSKMAPSLYARYDVNIVVITFYILLRSYFTYK